VEKISDAIGGQKNLTTLPLNTSIMPKQKQLLHGLWNPAVTPVHNSVHPKN
jgi:hypothetical protein